MFAKLISLIWSMDSHIGRLVSQSTYAQYNEFNGRIISILPKISSLLQTDISKLQIWSSQLWNNSFVLQRGIQAFDATTGRKIVICGGLVIGTRDNPAASDLCAHNWQSNRPCRVCLSTRKMSPRTLTFTNRHRQDHFLGPKAQTQHKGQNLGWERASQVFTNSQVSTRTWTGHTMFFMAPYLDGSLNPWVRWWSMSRTRKRSPERSSVMPAPHLYTWPRFRGVYWDSSIYKRSPTRRPWKFFPLGKSDFSLVLVLVCLVLILIRLVCILVLCPWCPCLISLSLFQSYILFNVYILYIRIQPI
jgi:hypothetical protein